MQTYELTLQCPVSKSFRSQKAANSLDINTEKKSRHHFRVEADIESDYHIGLIVGASGSGKTTLAKHLWGADCFQILIEDERPIIEQFPESLSYDECAALLMGVGLTQVPCWIRPVHTLSNGQRARAEIALQMAAFEAGTGAAIAIDEWTSVVDRTVAKVMSRCIQKFARRKDARIVLCSCHYDVLEWLNPDWVIDCNKQTYVDRRSLWRDYQRKETLRFTVREVDRSSWKYFSRYHYLSERLPGGKVYTFGLFCGDDQVGFECFANYVPTRKSFKRVKLHSNRCVIHPDYAGLGLGLKLIDICSEVMFRRGFEIYAKFSSIPLLKARLRSERWRLEKEHRQMKIVVGGNMARTSGFRMRVRAFTFKYLPDEGLALESA